MEVNSIYQSPNFGARILIQKKGFQNLGKDLVDSFEIGSRTTGTVSSSGSESTVFPSDAVMGFPFAQKISLALDKIGEIFNGIFCRNIKTTAIEGVDMKDVASKSAISTAGSGSISTGLGSYDAALASALDQSVNYPNSIYARSFPEFSANHLPESMVNHSAAIERTAYNNLWDPRASAGNECASSNSGSFSAIGAGSQGIGFKILHDGLSEGVRKLPS